MCAPPAGLQSRAQHGLAATVGAKRKDEDRSCVDEIAVGGEPVAVYGLFDGHGPSPPPRPPSGARDALFR